MLTSTNESFGSKTISLATNMVRSGKPTKLKDRLPCVVNRNTYNFNCKCSIFNAMMPTLVLFKSPYPQHAEDTDILLHGLAMYGKRSVIATYVLILKDDNDVQWAVETFGFGEADKIPGIAFFIDGECVDVLRFGPNYRGIRSPIAVEDALNRWAKRAAECNVSVYKAEQRYQDLLEKENTEAIKIG